MISMYTRPLLMQRIIVITLVVIFLLLPVFSINAQNRDVGESITGQLKNLDVGLPNPKGNITAIITTVINASLTLLGLIFLVITLYGGFMWMTASGNPEQVKKAGEMIRNGIIGLIIIFAAYAITLFVFDVLLNAPKIAPTQPTP